MHTEGPEQKKKMIFNPQKAEEPPQREKTPRQFVLDDHTKEFLQDMGVSWRQARRNGDRDSAARITQIVLKAIPKKSGRVSDWLGPKYFDELMSITGLGY